MIVEAAIKLLEKAEFVDVQALEDLVTKINKHTTTLFVTPNLDAISVSGRVAAAVVKALKLVKIFPMIRTENGNHKFGYFHG